MTVGEEVSATADSGFTFTGRTAIYGYEFAKRIVVSNFQIGRLAAVFQILALLTDGTICVELVADTCACRSAKRHVMLQPALRT